MTVKTFGKIDAAIACAGISALTPILTSKGSIDMKVFEKVLRINLYGSMYVAKHSAI